MPEVKIIPPVSQHAERLRVAAYIVAVYLVWK